MAPSPGWVSFISLGATPEHVLGLDCQIELGALHNPLGQLGH
jgi:hypothetical protein